MMNLLAVPSDTWQLPISSWHVERSADSFCMTIKYKPYVYIKIVMSERMI